MVFEFLTSRTPFWRHRDDTRHQIYLRALVRWHAAALGRGCVGTLVRWLRWVRGCAGALVHGCAGARVRWRAGALARWRAGALARWCAGALVRGCAGALVLYCNGVMLR